MDINSYINACREQRQGISFSFLAERCETSTEAPYRIKVADSISPEETAVVVIAGSGGNKINLRGYNSILRDTDNFIKSIPEFKDQSVRVCAPVSEFGDFHIHEVARHGLTYEKSYPHCYAEFVYDIPDKCKEETLNPQYIKDIFAVTIAPRISTPDGKHKLDQQQALKNIRRLTFVGHCHAGYVVMQLEKLMNDKMNALGYSPEEQKQLKSQLVALIYNPDCPKEQSQLYFVAIESSQDNHNKYQNYMREWLLMKPRDFGVAYLDKRWGRTLLCAQVDKAGIEGNPPRVYVAREVHDFTDLMPTTPQPNQPYMLGEHDFMGFVPAENMSKGAKKLQMFANNILKNSVKNSLAQDNTEFVPLPNIQHLVADNTQQKYQFSKAAFTGFRLFQQLVFTNKQKIDEHAQYRWSIPTITLD